MVLDALGNRVLAGAPEITVALGANPAGGTLRGATAVLAVNGISTFANLSLARAGVGYTLTASAPGLAGATSVPFAIAPVAPARLVFQEQPTNTLAGAAIAPAVRVGVVDRFGNAVTTAAPDVTIALGSNPGGSTFSPAVVRAVNGVATFTDLRLDKAGTGYRLAASAPDLLGAASTAFDVAPAAAKRLVFTTQPANTPSGAPVSPAIAVSVWDGLGNLVTDGSHSVTLALGANPAGGTLSGTLTAATSRGVATFANVRLDKAGAGYTLVASANGLVGSESAPFDVRAGQAASLRFRVQPGSVEAGAAITPAVMVMVLDAAGNLVTDTTATVAIAIAAGPSDALSGATSATAINGLASFADLSLRKAGTGYALKASAPGVAAVVSDTFDVTPAAPARLVFAGQPGNTAAGAAITPAVKVVALDRFDNVASAAGAFVTLALGANPGDGTLTGATTAAVVDGAAIFADLRIDRAAAGYTLAASSSGLAGATSAPFDIVPASGQRLAFLIRPVSSTAGAAITPAVEVGVLDLFGNLVTTATTEITLRLNDNPSGGTLSGTTTVRALNGIATFADLSVDKAGAGYTLHAGATGLGGAVSTAFDISPAAAAKLAFDVQPSSTPSGVAIAPAVKVVVQDAFGNAVTAGRYSITMALETNPAGGTLWGTTALSSTLGAAAFANLKIDNAGVGYTLKATAPGLVPAISKAFAVTFGRAYRLAFVTQPGTTTAGVPFSPALTVEVRDSAGNRVTEGTTPVTMGIGFNSNGGTLSGTANVNTANGIATFADLSLDKEGYRYTLKATAAGLIAATSDEFYVKSGPATRLVFGTQPTDTAAGMPIAPGFGTLAVDRFGNIDRGFEGVVNIAIAANPVGGTLLGTTSSRSMTGSAPFGDLSIRQAGAGYTFVASSEGLTSVTSAAFDITPGPAKVLVILTQPSDATAGAAIAPAVRVQAQDEYTNPVTTARLSVAAVLVDNPGEARLLGATTTSTAGGIATFSSLALDKVGAGYTLQFSAPGLNPVTSAPFAVTPGADAKLAFAAQPGTVVAGAAVAPTPKVVVLDRFNNVTGSAARISIALGANPAGGALIGASTVTAVDGAATFPDLHINKAGRGYTLAASTEGLAGAVSNAFAVLPGPAAALAFTVQPANATSGAAITPAVQVAVVDRFGNLLPAARHSVALALGANPAGGTLSGGTTAAAAQGVATFADVRVDKAGSGYTLTASAAGLTAATSTAFDVAAGTATRLAFRAQPTDGTAGAPLAPAITVVTLDAAGNPAPATGRVTLSLGANPGSGTLAGALTASLVNGVATFADLSLDKAGTGYTFAATATGLESATSAPFAIKAAAPAALEFVAQPSNSTAGAAIAPPLKVAVLDRFGNRATAPETTITLALGSNPSGGTLSGTATQIARDGSAGFTDLSIDKAGKGYTLTASAPGLTGATSVAFDVAADRAARLLFSTQPGPAVAGAPFAPAPRVTAEDRLGNAVPITGAVTVALGANPAGGALSGPTSVAPKDGVVLLANLSIQKAGNGYTLVVSAADLPAVASAAFDVSAAGPARLEFLAQPTATAAGAPLKPAPKVGLLDAFGNRAPVALDVTLALGAAPAGGSLSGTATVRTSDGVAEFADLSIDKAGAGYTLAASAADVAGATSAPFPITPGAAARLTFVVQPAATPSAAAITPAVKVSVLDRLGNVVTAGRIPVTLALDANPSAGTLYGTTRTYTAQGTALFSNLRVDRAGQGYTLKAEATGMTAATSAAFDVTSGRAFRVAFLTQPGTATAGAPIPAAGIAAAPGSARPTAAAGISVEVLDGAGNRVAGDTSITLVIRSNPAGGTLSGTTTATAVNGVATFPDVKIDKAGDGYTLKAVAEGLATATSAAFSVNPGAPARLVFAAQPASAPAGAAIAPAVRVAVQDAFGNAVLATPEITLALGANPAGGTLAGAVTARAAAGVATFADLSISKAGAGYTLAASAEGLAGATSSAFNITPDAATRLEFVAQPASTTAGAALAPVKVALVDRFGNVATTAAGSVTLALGANPAGGTLAGRVTVRAAAGVATFDALSIAKAGTGYTLEASSGGLAGATSGAFAISPAAAAKLLFHVQPADTASRAAIEPAVQVAVQDAFGNLVTTGRHTVTVALGANPSEGTLSGTATATTAAGVATFANLRVDRAGADYTLTASADGLASATSAPFDVTAGQAFRLVFAVQPRATTAGAAIAPAVVVQAVDAAGNRVSSNADITVAIRNSPAGGTLSGGTTIGAMGGAATFGNLTINRAGAGYTLKATATGLATATSAAFDVAPGPAAKMAFTVQPSDTTAGEALVPAVEVSVQDALGNLVPDAAGEVALALAQNPAGGALAGARTARLAGGKATFTSLSLDKAGSGYALGATFSGMSATSAAFDVAAGPAARLAFAAEPQAAAEGVLITPPVRIAVQDEFGNAVLARTRVTLALQGGPAGAALSGTTAADAVRGVATFSDLRINRAGSGYTLVASAPELAGATTAPFAVASTLKPDLLIKQGTGAAPYAIDNVYQPDEPAGAQIVGLESVPAGTAVFQVRVQNDGNTPAHFILRRTSAALAGGWAFTATAAGADITDALGQDAGYRTGLLAPRAAETLLLKVTPGTSLEDGSAAAVDLAAFVEGAGTAGDRVRAVTTVHGVAVQGRLTTSDGRPLPAQTVVELLSRRTVVASTVADAGGAYRLSVAPGTYDLQARAAGYVPLLVPDLDVAGTGEGSGAVTVNLLLPPQPDFGAGTNLVTFPFEFEQGKVESVVGDPDALYQWLDPATGRYRTSGTHVMPAAVPGRGFWLKQKRGYPADGYQIVQPGVMPAQNRAFILPLDLGWQIIGNPFATGDIQLSQIKVLMPGSLNPVPLTAVPNAVHDYLWGWNGTKYELVSAEAEGETTTLRAYKGYLFNALIRGVRLYIEQPAAGAAAASAQRKRSLNKDEWRVRLVATAGSQAGVASILGVGGRAYTLEAPPAQGSLEVAVVSRAGSRAAVDVRTGSAGALVWNLEVAGGQDGQEVTLTWPDLGGVPRDTRLVLVDEATGQRRQMRTTGAHSFRANGAPRRFRVEAERSAGALLAVTGIEVTASRGAGRAIAYTLSADAAASVEIVSPSGRIVRRVSAAQAAARGRNQAYWDGRDDRGVTIPSGLVLVRITATTEDGAAVQAVRPVVLVR